MTVRLSDSMRTEGQCDEQSERINTQRIFLSERRCNNLTIIVLKYKYILSQVTLKEALSCFTTLKM